MADAEFQKSEYVVWSGVLAALANAPIIFVSLKSFAYRAVPSAGGAGGRNCMGEVITQGVWAENCR